MYHATARRFSASAVAVFMGYRPANRTIGWKPITGPRWLRRYATNSSASSRPKRWRRRPKMSL